MRALGRGLLRVSILSATVSALALAAAPAAAQRTDVRSFDIPAQPLSSALLEFSKQSDVMVVVSPTLTEGKRSPALKGTMPVNEAIGRLLAGSRLRAAPNPAGGYIVSTGTPQGNALAGAPNAGSDTASSSGDEVGVSEILVVGSRSQNVDIKRTEDDAQPYVVFNSEEIQKSGAANLEQFLRNRLPMNAQSGSNAQEVALGGGQEKGNTSGINLRGLGIDRTLVLVDGRRAPRYVGFTATGTSPLQGDINGIPISAVERIEILPSTAGAIYGGGAVGGVINIIRKRDYHGLDMRIQGGGAFRGGAEQVRIELNGGFSPDHGKTRFSVSGSLSRSNPLSADDNDLWKRARSRALSSSYPGFDPHSLSFQGFSGSTPNVIAQGRFDLPCFFQYFDALRCTFPQNLTLDDGTPLNSNFTYVPFGYAGPQTDGGAALVANAGRLNTNLAPGILGRDASLIKDPKTASANLNIRRSFSPKLDAFIDAGFERNTAKSVLANVVPAVRLLANDPNNPFRQNVWVYFPTETLDRSVKSTTTSSYLTGGLIYKLYRDWTASFEYNRSRAETKSAYSLAILPEPGNAGPFNDAFRSGSLSPIRDTNQYPLDFSPFLLNPEPRVISGPLINKQSIVSGRFGGTLVNIPGGSVRVNSLLERRAERINDLRYYNENLNTTIFPHRKQTVTSVYAEVTVPVFSRMNAAPVLRDLELIGSVRHDKYETNVAVPAQYSYPTFSAPVAPNIVYDRSQTSSTNYTLASRWSPVGGLIFRASYSTGFLPPNISQLVPNPPGNVVTSGISDPKRGNTNLVVPYQVLSGGNSALAPEDSKSLSFGLIIKPAVLGGIRFSADFTRIRKSNEIISLNILDVLANEDVLPNRVVRATTNLPGDSPGWSPPVVSINSSLANIAKSEVKTWDFQADYDLRSRLGNFRFYSVATYYQTFKQQLLPTSAAFDTVDFSDGPLKWRGNLGVDWTYGDHWRAGWNAQYYDSYSVRSGKNATNNDLLVQIQGAKRIPHQIYNDAYVGYTFGTGSRALKSLELILGIQNIFDKKPPALATLQPTGTYSPYGDPRLRRYTLTLSKPVF